MTTETAPLFFDFEQDQSPDDFFKSMFLETCNSTDDSPEDLDSFKEFVLAFISDNNFKPIRDGFDIVYKNKNVERISILVNLQCLTNDEKTKALKILANTNKPISSLINVDNVSETIVSLFNGGRETEAFELINKFEVKKIDVSAIEKDTLNYLLRMTLNNFSLIHVFVLLFNSSLEPVEMLFDFIEENADETRLIDYFTTIQSQALKEFSPSIKKHLAKILPSLKSNIESYELVIKNLGITFTEHDDYKIGYYSVESANQSVLSMLADNNYYTKETLPKIIQSCIKFNKPKLFTYFLNTYGNMITDSIIDENLGVIKFNEVDFLIEHFDFFGVLKFFKENTVVYKDFFNIYLTKFIGYLENKKFNNIPSVMELILHYYLDNKVYLSLLIQEKNKHNLDLSIVVDYYYSKDDFDFIGTFIEFYSPSYKLGSFIEEVKEKSLDETWFNFVNHVICKNNQAYFIQFLTTACHVRIAKLLHNINDEIVKESVNNLLTLMNKNLFADFIAQYGYSPFTSDLFQNKDFQKICFGKYLSLDVIKILVNKRANLFMALSYSINRKDVDLILFCIENIKFQKLNMTRKAQYIMINDLLVISRNNESHKIIAFETFKLLWDSNLINLKSVTKNLLDSSGTNDDIYNFLINKDIYRDFDRRNSSEELAFADSISNSEINTYSYGKETVANNQKTDNKNKTQLKLQKEENFDFMKKKGETKYSLWDTVGPFAIWGILVLIAVISIELTKIKFNLW